MFIRLAMLCLLPCVGLAHAEGTLEVIPLHNRTVEEVMPSLRPLLEPGGTLTGMQGQLILRASDANRAEIKQALAAIDTIPRQLTITVRQSLNRADTRQAAELFGKIDGRHVDLTLPPAGTGGAHLEIAGDRARIGARLDDRSLDQVSQVSQHLRVADGVRALISRGQKPGRLADLDARKLLEERGIEPRGAFTEVLANADVYGRVLNMLEIFAAKVSNVTYNQEKVYAYCAVYFCDLVEDWAPLVAIYRETVDSKFFTDGWNLYLRWSEDLACDGRRPSHA